MTCALDGGEWSVAHREQAKQFAIRSNFSAVTAARKTFQTSFSSH